MPKEVGGTVWQAAGARVGGVRGCCGHLCQCGAALLLLLLFSSTEISSGSSSDEVRRGVGSPEPGHRAQHRPERGLLHLHLQLGGLQGLAHDHLSSTGEHNLLPGQTEHWRPGKQLRLGRD